MESAASVGSDVSGARERRGAGLSHSGRDVHHRPLLRRLLRLRRCGRRRSERKVL